MGTPTIGPEQLPEWVPGRLTVQSPADGWNGVSVRGYQYQASDVEVPPLSDYVIVAYRHGTTAMRRRIDAEWISEQLGPGDVSLLTRAVESHWVWPGEIEVVHVYLGADELAATCREMYDRDVADVELHDEVRADDPAIHRTAMLVDSLACQLSVHILRRHAHVLFREPSGHDGLSFAQERAIRDYVQSHLADRISLEDLAATVALSRFHFARRFRQSTGASPHEFVLAQRVERAATMLSRTDAPLRDIALRCGFADQSHLTRVFKKHIGTTPGRYRAGR